MTQIGDSNYDWERCYKYRGNSGDMHYVYRLWYVPAGRSDSHNQYGYYDPKETLLRVNLGYRDDPIKAFRWIDKDTGIGYKIDYGYMESYIFSWSKLANMSIDTIYIDESLEPNTIGFVTIDINNTGGDGNYDAILYDGTIELDRDPNVMISGGMSERSTLTFQMIPRDMNLTIKLIDNDTGDTIDTETRTVTLPDLCDDVVCDDKCIGLDKYSQVCDEGVCSMGELVEANSEECGFVPEPVYYGDIDRDGTIGQMDAILTGKYVVYGAGTYPLDEDQLDRADVDADGDVDYDDVLLISRYIRGEIDKFPANVEPDPCALVNCGTECIGFNLHQSECVDGQCVAGALIEVNSTQCGYVAPGPDPEDEPDTMTYVYIIAGIIVAFIMLMRS